MRDDKKWDTEALLGLIEAAAKDFAKHASTKKLHPKVLDFLKEPEANKVRWIGENVSHSNVAVQAASLTKVFPVASNSTQTQITDQIIVKRR